ncbi:TniQ family protein [Leptolyngbya sp. FACHB-17]|uniref:TniQ family protein n=1 Tax=unclassified Leptolyngbya TaxID=2650499 RepID=UPI00167FF0A3|nr:TniQ family protein [Leptolyngbya sp. FACHB-17]MBD2079883.1 TniQ family protein [Leptolyngbya sp. FACHB-17]
MSQPDENVPRLGYVEPLEHESISHYLGRLRRFKANRLPSAYSLGQAAGIGAVTARWEKLYFNPVPTDEELGAIARLIDLDPSRFQAMLPHQGMTLQPRPIRLCGACYAEVPCHRMVWQHKDVVAVCTRHNLRLLERCPSCKRPFQIPALWTDGRCHHCGMRFTAMVKYQERSKKAN